MTLPLSGVRVIELGSFIAGPFCATQLADLGADVVKVEQPGCGDTLRETGPFLGGESSIFMQVNRNKRSLALDITSTEGAKIFRRLVRSADVLVVSLRPTTVERLRFTYRSLSRLNPRLVYVSVSGWGLDGPYSHLPGFDIMAQAMSGIMSITGESGGPPAKAGIPVCDLACALYASIGALAALRSREHTGRGQLVESSLFEAGVSLTLWEFARYQSTGEVPQARGSAHQSSAPYQAFHANDGYVTIGANSQRQWEKLCSALELESLLVDPRFKDNSARHGHRRELEQFIEQATRKMSVDECQTLLERVGVPCAPVHTYDQVVQDPQLLARRFFGEWRHPVAGPVRQLGSGVRVGNHPVAPRSPSPLLGQHTTDVLEEAGVSAQRIGSLARQGVISFPNPQD